MQKEHGNSVTLAQATDTRCQAAGGSPRKAAVWEEGYSSGERHWLSSRPPRRREQSSGQLAVVTSCTKVALWLFYLCFTPACARMPTCACMFAVQAGAVTMLMPVEPPPLPQRREGGGEEGR